MEEQERNKEIEDRDAIIESLHERLAQAERMDGNGDTGRFEEKMRMQGEGFQEQVSHPFFPSRFLSYPHPRPRLSLLVSNDSFEGEGSVYTTRGEHTKAGKGV